MNNLLQQLEKKLQEPLPGLEAQMRMAPPVRTRDMKIPVNVRYGAVMILLYEEEKEWHTLLIRRVEDGHTHSGQISFPGGKKDEDDLNDWMTALRECEEEIEVLAERIRVLGSLTPLFIPPSNFLVTPVIGFHDGKPNFRAYEGEVQEVIPVPLKTLLSPTIKKHHPVFRSDNPMKKMQTPVYYLHDDIIVWGATAMMISELEALLLPS